MVFLFRSLPAVKGTEILPRILLFSFDRDRPPVHGRREELGACYVEVNSCSDQFFPRFGRRQCGCLRLA
jgi:hypothetical protein